MLYVDRHSPPTLPVYNDSRQSVVLTVGPDSLGLRLISAFDSFPHMLQ